MDLHSFFAGPNLDPAVFLNADPDSVVFYADPEPA